jgi:hypothetical protein
MMLTNMLLRPILHCLIDVHSDVALQNCCELVESATCMCQSAPSVHPMSARYECLPLKIVLQEKR